MRKAILAGILLISAALGSAGCVALLAGAGGTVVWQGGKVISEERKVPMDRAVAAVKAVFRARKITLKEDVSKTKATQLRGEDPSGANVNVDVISTGPTSSRLEIRVGLGDKSAARQLLDDIKERI
ncbi:MAG: DUF3568 family protein [Candidatus Omnitrophica bacterium]|nr:DUF3568 family protein [Candidatus Omnitrophota bacterium]